MDKNPGLRPIGVGEVLRRIAGKVVMMLCKKKKKLQKLQTLQLSTGQDSSAEAAIHAMRDMFADVNTDPVLLIDAENAFSSINRKVM